VLPPEILNPGRFIELRAYVNRIRANYLTSKADMLIVYDILGWKHFSQVENVRE
jgi:hypothetical protein